MNVPSYLSISKKVGDDSDNDIKLNPLEKYLYRWGELKFTDIYGDPEEYEEEWKEDFENLIKYIEKNEKQKYLGGQK